MSRGTRRLDRETGRLDRVRESGSGDWRAWPDGIAWRLVPAIVWMAVIFALSARHTIPQPPGFTPDATAIVGHLGAYAVLAATFWWALGLARVSVRARLGLAFGLAILYGLTDEFHQSFVPGRHPDVFDLLVDAIGAALALGAIRWWLERREMR